MSVGDCQNLDRCLLFPIEDSEWEASQDEFPASVLASRPALRC